MNALQSPEWRAKAVDAAMALRSMPELMALVRVVVGEILKEAPQLPDDPLSRECLTILVWDRLQAETGSQRKEQAA